MKGVGLYDNNFLSIKEGKDLIIENIRRIILTVPGENVGNLSFGCKLREYLFDFESHLLEDAEQVVYSAITRWEPRVIVSSINVEVDKEMKGTFHIYVSILLKETYEKINLEIPIVF